MGQVDIWRTSGFHRHHSNLYALNLLAANFCKTFSQLGKLDSLMKALHKQVTLEVQTSDPPAFLNSPTFPLNHLRMEHLHLDAEIKKVKSKAASVSVLKESIQQELVIISDTLRSTKKKWKSHQESSHSMAPLTGLAHSTGRSCSEFEYKCFADFFCFSCRPFFWPHLARSRSHNTPAVGLPRRHMFDHPWCQLPMFFFYALDVKIYYSIVLYARNQQSWSSFSAR